MRTTTCCRQRQGFPTLRPRLGTSRHSLTTRRGRWPSHWSRAHLQRCRRVWRQVCVAFLHSSAQVQEQANQCRAKGPHHIPCQAGQGVLAVSSRRRYSSRAPYQWGTGLHSQSDPGRLLTGPQVAVPHQLGGLQLGGAVVDTATPDCGEGAPEQPRHAWWRAGRRTKFPISVFPAEYHRLING